MYVIFPADEVVYLSYGRVIYIPPSSPPSENLTAPPARASCSSGSHVSYPSLPSTSTNSSTRSHHSTKSWPIEPRKPQDPAKTSSLSSLNGSNSGPPPVRPKRKKDSFFKLPSLLSKSKPKTPVLERKLSFSDFETFAKERREKSVESVINRSSDFEYQVSRRSKQDQAVSNPVNGESCRPSILKSGKCVTNKTNRSPCLMIRETDVFNFERPSSSRCDDPANKLKPKSEVSVPGPSKSANAKPVRKISSEKSPQIKITSDKSPQRNQREKTPSTSSRGILSRSFSLKPNSSRYFLDKAEFSASFDRDYREVTPPTNSCREKSPPGKVPEDKKQLSKSLYNKPAKLLKKPLQLSKSFKEITTPPPVKTPSTPTPGKKSPSSKSLTVDFDSLFRRETSPAKVSLKNLAPKFEDDSSRLECGQCVKAPKSAFLLLYESPAHTVWFRLLSV
ncbi:serine/arginine repetitive matrix protein 1-like [Harmonia axyridis]|uniref:serine/arginine repetitive matrix protein 1-like n=1 Tax=Harmonia axyridis TaxID=115357 RepID=UPI001E276D35|nr:serine/arginine repetitive matrix protein 1-like [Harmonia axyridis]